MSYKRSVRSLFTVVAFVLLSQSSISSPEKSPEDREHVILAVFAHPDDEASVSPVLVKYARQGVSVYLATVTDGRLGINEHTGISAGDSLAAIRKKELICAAEKLGIKPPIMFGLHDQLKMNEGLGELSNQLDSLRKGLKKLFAELKPDIVLTWDPSGWSGHLDHRLVVSVVTEVFESQKWGKPSQLYYAAIPTDNKSSNMLLATVDPSYLTVKVPVEEEDYEKAKTSLLCHESQFALATIEQMRQRVKASNGIAYFRPFIPVVKEKDTLF